MSKLPECASCLFYARDTHLICAMHPSGPSGDTCLDFRPDPKLEGKHLGLGAADEVSELEDGVTYYNGELIRQPKQLLWHREEIPSPLF